MNKEKIEIVEIVGSLDIKGENEKAKDLDRIVADIYNNRKKFKRGILSCSVNQYNYAFITLDFKKISKLQIKKYKLNLLINGYFPLQQCSYCGCHYVRYPCYYYRYINGSVGRSLECATCCGFKNSVVSVLSKISKKVGIRRTKKFQLSSLCGEEHCFDGIEKIVKLDIVRNKALKKEHIISSFYLINPKQEDLDELKEGIEKRHNEGKEFFDVYIRDFSGIKGHISEYFKSVEIETVEVKW